MCRYGAYSFSFNRCFKRATLSSTVIVSRSCVREIAEAGVKLRTCKLHSRSWQHKNDRDDLSESTILITAELEPRCHVAQKSQIIASTLPAALAVRFCSRNGKTRIISPRGTSNTPSDLLLFKTAKKSRSLQYVISSGTNLSSRLRRGFIFARFNKTANSSRVILRISLLYLFNVCRRAANRHFRTYSFAT